MPITEQTNFDLAVERGSLDVWVTPEKVTVYPVSPEWQARGFPAEVRVVTPGHVDVIGALSANPVQISGAALIHQDELDGRLHVVAGPARYTDVLPAIAAAQAREGVQDPGQVRRADCVEHNVMVEFAAGGSELFPDLRVSDAATGETLWEWPVAVWPARPKRLV
jgi:hypothetical protein